MIHYGKFTSPVTPCMCWNSFGIEIRKKNEYVRKITRIKRILSIIGSFASENLFFSRNSHIQWKKYMRKKKINFFVRPEKKI